MRRHHELIELAFSIAYWGGFIWFIMTARVGEAILLGLVAAAIFAGIRSAWQEWLRGEWTKKKDP